MSYRQTDENLVEILRRMRSEVDELLIATGSVRQNTIRLGDFVLEAEDDTKVKMYNLETGKKSYVGRVVCDCGREGCFPLGDVVYEGPTNTCLASNTWPFAYRDNLKPVRIPGTDWFFMQETTVVNAEDFSIQWAMRLMNAKTGEGANITHPDGWNSVFYVASDPVMPNRFLVTRGIAWGEPFFAGQQVWTVTINGPDSVVWHYRGEVARPTISDAPPIGIIYNNVVYLATRFEEDAAPYDNAIAKITVDGAITYSETMGKSIGPSESRTVLAMAVNPETGILYVQNFEVGSRFAFNISNMETVWYADMGDFSSYALGAVMIHPIGPDMVVAINNQEIYTVSTVSPEEYGFWYFLSNQEEEWQWPLNIQNPATYFWCGSRLVSVISSYGSDEYYLTITDFTDLKNPCITMSVPLTSIVGTAPGLISDTVFPLVGMFEWDESSVAFLAKRTHEGSCSYIDPVGNDPFFGYIKLIGRVEVDPPCSYSLI